MLADAEGDAGIATCGLLTSIPKLSQRVFRELNLISTSLIDIQNSFTGRLKGDRRGLS